jgi:hypothetical protein
MTWSGIIPCWGARAPELTRRWRDASCRVSRDILLFLEEGVLTMSLEAFFLLLIILAMSYGLRLLHAIAVSAEKARLSLKRLEEDLSTSRTPIARGTTT